MLIHPSRVSGQILIQPSKSYLHRLIICAALSGAKCTIHNVNASEDISATLSALYTMGLCTYKATRNDLVISKGDGRVKGDVDCGESGSTLRFLIGVALTLNEEVTFVGHGRLMERPQSVYEELCKKHNFTFKADNHSITVKGQLKAGPYSLRGGVSSQFITGLCLGLAKTGGKSTIEVTDNLESAGYVDVTLDVLDAFGVNVGIKDNTICVDGRVQHREEIYCPGDWSHAANFACMGAALGGVSLKGLDYPSLQRDSHIISILQNMGAVIECNKNQIVFNGSRLHGVDIDGTNIPDIIPVLAVLAGVCQGSCRIYGIDRLRYKESDRIAATVGLINAIGGNAKEVGDEIIITGVKAYKGGNACACNDHRIAMAAAVASVYADGDIALDEPGCVKKSAPEFWKEFAGLGGSFVF